MRRVAYFCDRCGAQINESDDYICVDVGIGERYRVDLCAQCVEAYHKFLDDFVHLAGCEKAIEEEGVW